MPDFLEAGSRAMQCPSCKSTVTVFINWGAPDPVPHLWPLCQPCAVAKLAELGVPELKPVAKP